MAMANGDMAAPLKLYAAGSNAHRQLVDREGDVRRFEQISTEAVDVLLATWSTLSIITTATELIASGHQKATAGLQSDVILHSAIGDHNGLVGALDSSGRLRLVSFSPESRDLTLRVHRADSALPLSHVALAGNGRVVGVFRQTPGAGLAHIAEFTSFDAFKAWHSDPTNPAHYPSAHHMVAGRPRQVVAGTGTFIMLMESGDVFSWGDPRHRSLARSTLEDGATAAEKPGLVDALGGLVVREVCAGGWMGGAVTTDGAGYLWGSGLPGKSGTLSCLQGLRSEERAALIQLCGGNGEELDVRDLAIGDGHVGVVTACGGVFVAGENRNGQLGTDSNQAFVEEWVPVSSLKDALRVVCGPKSTLVFTA